MLLTRQLLFRFVRTDIQQQYLPRFPFQIRVRIDYVPAATGYLLVGGLEHEFGEFPFSWEY